MNASTENPKAEISTAEQAYSEIQRRIVTGEIEAYALLSENDLARRIGCGRTPVREALQRLKFEGFVDVLPRRGIMVTPVDVNRQLELLETRRPLEEMMVSLAAIRADESQRAEMLRLADDLEAAIAEKDRGRYLEINSDIHRIEAAAAGNRYLAAHIQMVHGLSRRFWYSFITETDRFSKAAVHHARVLRAISNGEPDMAVQEARALLDLLEEVSKLAILGRLNK